jgi:DNA repair and recombination protein RAD54 and RAD54-like protein
LSLILRQQFILRRTNTLLSKHLPPKLVQVVCVHMTPLQKDLYTHFLESKNLSAVMSGKVSGVLSSITALRKLVNHPKLIYDVVRAQQAAGSSAKKDDAAAGFEDCEKVRAPRAFLTIPTPTPSTAHPQFFPDNFHRERSACAEMSGKFELMSRMLTQLRVTTKDRIVIVSCYTQTLDLFTALCREKVRRCRLSPNHEYFLR